MKIMIRTFLIVSLTVVFLIQCGKQAEPIADVGSFTINKSDYIELLKKRYPNQTSFTDIDISVKKDLLEPLIINKLYLNEGYEQGLDQDPEFKTNLENFQIRILGSKYFERTIVDKLITPSMLDDAIARQGVELKASHILIGTEKSPRATNKSAEEAKALAFEVVARIKKGEDFTALVQEYSDDPSAKTNKGDLGYFVWGKMVPAFFDAAFALEVGQISDPVQSQYGFHIIRLDDRRPIKDYVENRGEENLYRTKQTLMRSFGDSARALWINNYDRLLEENDYKLYEENIALFSDSLKALIKDQVLTPESFPSGLRSLTFAEWDGGEISVASLIEKYSAQLGRVFSDFRDPAKLKKQIERLSMDSMVLLDAKNLALDKDEKVAKELDAFTEQQMKKLLEARQLNAKTEVTDEEVLAYYEEHTASFLKPEEIEIWEIDVTKEKLAKELAARAKKGENFEALARKYNEDKQLLKNSGYLGYKHKTARGSVTQEAHKIGPGGKIGGPVKYGRYFVVLKTGKKQAESVRSLEEVKKRIVNSVKSEKTKEAKIVWERQLRETYSVKIDEEELKAI